MKQIKIGILLQGKDSKLPTKATEGSAGFDLYCPYTFVIHPGQTIMIDTGIIIDCPKDMCYDVRSRSGLSTKLNIRLTTGVSTIDSDFRETLKVPLYRDICDKHFMIEPEELHLPYKQEGGRIAQIVFHPYTPNIELVEVKEMNITGRSGFGSTGK